MTNIPFSCPETTPVILVVDDDRSLRSLLNLAMAEEGYQVIEAKNGKECLAEYTRLQPDMVLLDAVMPDMDGFTCCQQLCYLPQDKYIPILMITVLDDEESVERAFTVGATDYITKPINWAVLSQRVRRLLIANQALVKAETVSKELHQYQEWEYLCRKILQQLCLSSHFEDNLLAIAADLRDFWQVERIICYQRENQSLVESTTPGYPSVEAIAGELLSLEAEYGSQYQQGEIVAIDDLSQADLPSTILEQFAQLKTQAMLIVPILVHNQWWGLLCIHSCQSSRHWHQLETERLSDLAKLIAIAIR